ncbi:hypothetical protein [Streptomyces sp. NPDC020917]|uniref:hypothetical protein n=1 Tax=Streptomyces sp. NPDC020917 TaxID=3365102 RepID=UPI0037ADAA1D
MMPQHSHAPARVCGHCDGFPTVHIATGNRRSDGTRPTIPVDCPVCHGTGTIRTRRALATAGR